MFIADEDTVLHLHMRRTLLIAMLACTVGARAQDCTQLPWEANLTYRANTIESSFVRGMSTVTSDALMPLAIGIPVGLYMYGALNVRVPSSATPEQWRYSAETGVQTFVTMGLTYGVVVLLKNVIDRPRPYQAYPECITNYRNDADGSMPSGHSAGAAALATSLSIRYPEWYVIVPSVGYALYTGFARMNLGMHYLSDVLVGYALGAGIAIGVNALNDALFDLAEPILPDEASHAVLPTLMPGTSTPILSLTIPL
jgi:undecaprenyl-diphosphatase